MIHIILTMVSIAPATMIPDFLMIPVNENYVHACYDNGPPHDTSSLHIQTDKINLRHCHSFFQKLNERRSQCEDSDTDLLVWTCGRVMKWTRSIDLGVSLPPVFQPFTDWHVKVNHIYNKLPFTSSAAHSVPLIKIL